MCEAEEILTVTKKQFLDETPSFISDPEHAHRLWDALNARKLEDRVTFQTYVVVSEDNEVAAINTIMEVLKWGFDYPAKRRVLNYLLTRLDEVDEN